MAHKKAGSSSKNGRDSVGQRLGVKAGDGQLVPAGSIIVRQRGMTFIAGSGTGLGRDYTVFATVTGHIRFDHASKDKKRVRVLPLEIAGTAADGSTAAERRPAKAALASPTSGSADSASATSGSSATATATKPTAKTGTTTKTTAKAATSKSTTARSKATAKPEATATPEATAD
jgi:large subunit ribosomal protein L27